MFGKLIALIILGIAIYNVYRIYERGKIRAELIKNGNKKVTHEDVVKEQKKRDEDRLIETIKKIEEQKRNEETIKEAEKNLFLKKKREFRPFTHEERKEYGQKKRELREKGAQYEAFIADHYRSLGYEVIEHGKIMGRRDAGIDIIAKNHREAIMIQCKNWNSNNKEKITHKEIGDFVGKVAFFIEKNPKYKQYEIKRIFTVSEAILDQSAIATINNNREMVKYEHIPFV